MTFVPPTTPTPSQRQGAMDEFNSILTNLGLDPTKFSGLVSDALTNGTDSTEFSLVFQASPQFAAAFPEVAARQKAGLAPMSAADIVNYKGAARSLAQQWGLPAAALDDQTISDLIVHGVSPSELNDRIAKGFVAVNQAPQAVKDQLLNYYGVTQGDLAHFFLDPTSGEAEINKKVAASQIGAAGITSGFGQLTKEESESLYGQGVSDTTAGAALGQLAQQKELMGGLPGEQGMTDLSRSQQLETVAAPQGATEQELARRASQRKAVFGGGGSYAQTSGGVAGLAENT